MSRRAPMIAIPPSRTQWVRCILNRDYKASLEVRKVYQVLADATGARHGLVRIIDESGEDYLYPKDYFLPVELSQPVKKALLRAS